MYIHRPDRTEVLSEGLQEAEKRIDQIKATCETTAKKIQACLQGQGKDGVSIDKRIVSGVITTITFKHTQAICRQKACKKQ